jgi:beta-glucosidase
MGSFVPGHVTSSWVVNRSYRSGDKVAIVYGRDMYVSITRPVKEVLAFIRVTLVPGEAQTLSFTLDGDQFGFYDVKMERVIEPGAFEI